MNEILKQMGNLFVITGGAITVRAVTVCILWKIMEQKNANRLYRVPNYMGEALDVITIIGGFVIYKQIGY
jgi:hypothetical protein